MVSLGPRVVIAGTHSGVGKTTVATGIIAALRRAGGRPSAAKIGPDFIDPGYHALASGRTPRNLDPWICGIDAVAPLAGRAAAASDVLVVEGVMGLFDGAPDGTPSSTADVAAALDAPLVLVVDASSTSTSIAAVIHGFATYRPESRPEAVILNRVGSDHHEQLLRSAIEPLGIPVVGALRRDDRLTWRDRHLGLVPVVERPEEVGRSLDRLAAAVAERVDLPAIVGIARRAPDRLVGDPPLPSPLEGRPRVAVAAGAAFSFTYTDTLDCLTAAGAEVAPFDPLHDPALPERIDGLLIGGGFPEMHLPALVDNASMRRSVASALDTGLPTWAECGGFMWLCRSIDHRPAVGAVPACASMAELTLGYCVAETRADSPLGPTGTVLRGHEFHHGRVDPVGHGLSVTRRGVTTPAGWATPTLLASFVHHHPGGDPTAVGRFVETCVSRRVAR
ncbi:MAG: cobyrinate a,c-diamide synthase [Acidimicrobiales bacterium]